jgi:hypothetical protein
VALEEDHADTYLTQLRRACEELYGRAQLVSQSFPAQLPQPSPRQYLGSQDPVAETDRENGPVGQDPVDVTVLSSHVLPAMPQGGDGCTFGIEPQSNGIESSAGGWPRTGETTPYPWLAPWGLDMLLEGDFASFI